MAAPSDIPQKRHKRLPTSKCNIKLLDITAPVRAAVPQMKSASRTAVAACQPSLLPAPEGLLELTPLPGICHNSNGGNGVPLSVARVSRNTEATPASCRPSHLPVPSRGLSKRRLAPQSGHAWKACAKSFRHLLNCSVDSSATREVVGERIFQVLRTYKREKPQGSGEDPGKIFFGQAIRGVNARRGSLHRPRSFQAPEGAQAPQGTVQLSRLRAERKKRPTNGHTCEPSMR